MISQAVLKEMDFETPEPLPEVYENNKMVIFRPRITLDRKVAFSYYHLIIPIDPLPVVKVNGKDYPLDKRKQLLWVNPYQDIEVEVKIPGIDYLAVFIERKFAEDIFQEGAPFPDEIIRKDLDNEPDIRQMANRFIYECKQQQPGYIYLTECIGAEMIIQLVRSALASPGEPDKKYQEKGRIKRVIDYIYTNYNRDCQLDKLASLANLSTYHFIRVFKDSTGKTPFQFLLDVKVERAAELLKTKECNVTEVGLRCGFSNPSYFSTVFKKKTGFSPTQYRNSFID
ncbi:MAG: AraC family transcriptional regulator [Halanaerobium sp.]|nr:AraC family transcriptional regulator [Halanaerobium sp.]